LDISAIWRLLRDERENRGRTLQEWVASYLAKVRPMFFEHVAPTQRVADLSITGSDPVNVGAVIQLVSLRQNALSTTVPRVVLESPGSLGVFHHPAPGAVVSGRVFGLQTAM